MKPRPTSLASFAVSSGLGLALVLGGQSARADILPEGMHPIKVAVTFEAPQEGHVVAYPIDCMGLDTKLNPSLEYFQNYDVLETGKPREPYKTCGNKTKVWVLDKDKFKKVPGEKVPAFARSEWKLEELSKIKVDERPLFFEKSKDVHATGFAMPAVGLVKDENPLAEVAETVSFGGIPAQVQTVKLVYTYKDGEKEEHTYKPPMRPQPKRPTARDWMGDLADLGADAGAAAAPEAPVRTNPLFRVGRDQRVTTKKPNAEATPVAEAPKKHRLGPNGKLMLGFGIVAAIAAVFALREDKKKG